LILKLGDVKGSQGEREYASDILLKSIKCIVLSIRKFIIIPLQTP